MYSSRRYYFLTIAETLNITRAAEKLMVSQPSLTQYLNKLEQTLGTKLVDRSYTPLRLTIAGELYRAYLTAAREADAELFARLNELGTKNRAPLRIGTPLQKTPYVTRSILPAFTQAQPDISLSIWEGTTLTVRQRVLSGDVEIGFGHYFDASDAECVIEPINDEMITIVCSDKNPVVGGRQTSPRAPFEVQPEDLNEQLFFQMSPEYFLYEVAERELRKHGVSPRRRMVLSNLHSMLDLVVKGHESGFTFMPDFVLDEAGDLSGLAFLRLGSENLDWKFCMIRRKTKRLSPEGRLFWDTVTDNCRKV